MASLCGVRGCLKPVVKHMGLCAAHGKLAHAGVALDIPLKKCTVEGCNRPHHALGLCAAHYHRQRKGQSLSLPVLPRRAGAPCAVEGCRLPLDRHSARGFCRLHYARLLRRGTTDDPPREARRCSVPGCDLPHYGLGFCAGHYSRHKTGRPLDPPLRPKLPAGEAALCLTEGCGRIALRKGLCDRCDRQKQKRT